MRIDNWPMDRIMRLPDWCFGRRWFVGTYQGSVNGTVHYNISAEQLPDKFVVWGAFMSCMSPSMLQALRMTMRLALQAPVSVETTRVMDRVFKDISEPNIVYEFACPQNGCFWLKAERTLIESAGRRLVVVTNGDAAIAYEATAAIQISALPKEVPDWLFSEKVRNP